MSALELEPAVDARYENCLRRGGQVFHLDVPGGGANFGYYPTAEDVATVFVEFEGAPRPRAKIALLDVFAMLMQHIPQRRVFAWARLEHQAYMNRLGFVLRRLRPAPLFIWRRP